MPVAAFLLSEYLPGRDFGCQSVWKDGELVLIKTYERLSYLGMGSQPSRVSSVAGARKDGLRTESRGHLRAGHQAA